MRARAALCMLLLGAATASARQPGPAPAHLSVDGPRTWDFPADHGAHPGYATEWWYLTGHLEDGGGRRWALQVVFFSQQIGLRTGSAPPGWAPPTLMPAHAALTDLDRGSFLMEERLGRTFGGMARAAAGTLDVSVGSWRLAVDPSAPGRAGAGSGWRLEVDAEGFAVALDLAALESPMLHGEQGYSIKNPSAPSAERAASYYYSIPRLEARGRLRAGPAGSGTSGVTGTLWFDHEFFSGWGPGGLEGWDWLGLRLDDGRALMVTRVRQGGADHLWGTFRPVGGTDRSLTASDLGLEALGTWRTPDRRASYPVAWRLTLPSEGLDVRVEADHPASELDARRSTLQRYWEGSITVRDAGTGQRVGEGFLEMTGYSGPLPGGGGTTRRVPDSPPGPEGASGWSDSEGRAATVRTGSDGVR